MPRCVAAGCDSNHSHNVSFHQFPKDEILRKKWNEAVSRTRLHFQGSAYSVLCSKHFAPDDYEPRSVLAQSIGLSGRNTMRLKKGAIPSIFTKPSRPGQLLCNEKKKRRLSTAYEKRERARVMNEIDIGRGVPTELEDLEQSPSSAEDVPISNEAQIQTEPIEPHHCECCIHKQPNVKMVNFSVQFRTRMTDKGMQIFPDDEDIRVDNCDFSGNDGNTSVVAADNANKCDTTDAITSGAKNTLDKVADKTVGESADKAESEPEDEAEHETDSEEADSEDDDSTTDPDYEPFDDIEMEADQGEDDVDHVAGDVYKGRKFLVYEDQLLAAFQLCPVCSSPAKGSVCAVQGTFCRIRQVCASCNFKRMWESQPMIKNTPAGNILLSAAILFSGSCVAKSLRFLRHLRCASIFHSPTEFPAPKHRDPVGRRQKEKDRRTNKRRKDSSWW
ncbi:uncharacterized protein LOC117111121 [Anneissia japonica]|uniref:uncharacterized protein LOC117111121 n=1 Tax=Anneissia japonica TaxID=1529436 RepID=UPI001425ADE8|nr:uncharacterized protein LOC117111121 [Anneissia japonica]